MDKAHKKALIADLDLHLKHNRALFPLRKGKKEPLEQGWPEKYYSPAILTRYINRGHNIAFKMDSTDLVLDIDPRHVKCLESLKRLTKDWATMDQTPIVETGGVDHGFHYYLKLPKKAKIKSNLQKYPGLDFRHIGQYVVVANSIHPSGKYYQWDILSPYQEPAQVIPDWLFKQLVWGSPEAKEHPPKQPVPTTIEQIPLETLQFYLQQLSILEYQDYEPWLQMAMASHSATSGEGLDIFLDWSLQDPLYEGDEDKIRAKWKSFKGTDIGITVATIVKAVLESGGELKKTTAIEDFQDIPIIDPKPKSEKITDFIEYIETLPPNSDLETLVKTSMKYGVTQWHRIRKAIKISQSIKYKEIDTIYLDLQRKKRQRKKKAEKDESPDYGILVANRVLTSFFNDGEHLLHAKNQQFYHYKKTHWELLPPNLVDKYTLEAAEDLATEPKMKFKASTTIPAAERVLVAKTAHVNDVLRLGSEPPACINTKNFEVWIDKGQGEPIVKKHSPESYLLNCLDTAYDTEARCPLFDQTINDIFDENAETDEMVRHFLEFFGYVIQPFKNIPSWWIFHGRGSNGKSLLMEVVQALLGDAVLPRPVADFADTQRNNHATANLVGKLLVLDDDADVNAFLPESALKKLSESKLLESNPKSKDAFTFRSTATPVVLINDWPRIRDLSWGMLRKAYIMPFRRSFDDLEMDLDRRNKIIDNELPGVLNRALEGYKRLRNRGGFSEPKECVLAKGEWLRLANPLMEFVASQTRKSGNGTFSKVGDIYEQYRLWCHNQGGVKHPLMQNRFEIGMLQLGYRTADNNDVKVFRGIEMKS